MTISQNEKFAQEAAAYLQQLEQIVLSDYPVDESLKGQDDQTYDSQVLRRQMKHQELTKARDFIAQARAQNEQQVKQWEVAQGQRLLDTVPEWREDPAAGQRQIGEWMTWAGQNYGWTPQELSQAGFKDARVVLMLRDLHRLSQSQGDTKQVVRKLKRTLPKVVKAGASQDASERQQDSYLAAKRNLARTGSEEDFDRAIERGNFLDR
jgi:hypothetical protein